MKMMKLVTLIIKTPQFAWHNETSAKMKESDFLKNPTRGKHCCTVLTLVNQSF